MSGMDGGTLQLVLKEPGPGLGEGPVWWKERSVLLWVQINKSKVGLFDPITQENRFINVPSHVGAVVPTTAGDLIAATAKGFIRIDADSGEVTELSDPEDDKKGNRFNDGKCDPWGRFWAGTMAYNFEKGAANLWRLDPDGTVSLQRSDVTCSNGLAWSLDRKKLYYIDSPTLSVVAFPLTDEGEIAGDPTTCFTIPVEEWGDGCMPDGMCIDEDGNLWVCLYDGSGVTKWDPETGNLMEFLQIPCKKVTSCCFGGENLDRLFITTCEWDGAEPEPLAGSIFQANVGVKGIPTDYYRG